ncbi:MAG: PASTA domain-containing protein, partial [Hymenobacteraceae bacterium]|nr:PASTA domain-containing protein [Hymenobacteraceae bacterium]
MSSNIGVAKLVVDEFRDKPKRYTDLVRGFGLGEPLGLQMAGEARPVVKSTENRSWSRTSLSTMAIGYEVKLAPIHTLAFYNAVANGGVKVRPYLVKEIRQADQVVQRFEPVVLKEKICSDATAAKLRRMMEGVVEKGTGKAVRSSDYKVAGKTGTAWKIINGRYVKKYITSFVGYFPADRPKYSCIVLIDSPSEGRIYGGDVAAPVFRELADKAFALDPARQAEMQGHTPDTTRRPLLPYVRAGQHDELALLCTRLGVRAEPVTTAAPDEWVKVKAETTRTMARAVQWRENAIRTGRVPDVVGLTLRDALFLLGNQGLRVTTQGLGHVVAQSLAPGTRAPVGTPLRLELRGPLPLESLYVAPAPTLVAAGRGVKPAAKPAPVRGRREERTGAAPVGKPTPRLTAAAPVEAKKSEKKSANRTTAKQPASKKPAVKKPAAADKKNVPKKPADPPSARKPTAAKKPVSKKPADKTTAR